MIKRAGAEPCAAGGGGAGRVVVVGPLLPPWLMLERVGRACSAQVPPCLQCRHPSVGNCGGRVGAEGMWQALPDWQGSAELATQRASVQTDP